MISAAESGGEKLEKDFSLSSTKIRAGSHLSAAIPDHFLLMYPLSLVIAAKYNSSLPRYCVGWGAKTQTGSGIL